MKTLAPITVMTILGWLILFSSALVPDSDPLLVVAGMCFGYVATKISTITIRAWRAIS